MHLADPTSRTYVSQQLNLHYTDWGNPDAPPLILVHGQRDHGRNWDWVAAGLRDRFHVLAPDLRGHGDSQWSPDGDYDMAAYLFDFAELVRQAADEPVSIIGHSLGGNIAVRYAGIYPDNVARLICIEGLGRLPSYEAERDRQSVDERLRNWIDGQRALGTRRPRRHKTFDAALEHMQKSNGHLSSVRVRHLTVHGLHRNDDGSFSWKFDPRVRGDPPADLTSAEIHHLWSRVGCPTLLVYGAESWATNPAEDGRLAHFSNARVSLFEGAGHWVHHDRLERFLDEARDFLAG